jgi:hypothetical protein
MIQSLLLAWYHAVLCRCRCHDWVQTDAGSIDTDYGPEPCEPIVECRWCGEEYEP